MSFNVPRSVIVSARQAALSSQAYKDVLAKIAHKYIWVTAFTYLYVTNGDAADLLLQGGISNKEVERMRKTLLGKASRDTRFIVPYLGASRALIDRAWDANDVATVENLLNQTFKDLREPLKRYVDVSKFNGPVTSDGL